MNVEATQATLAKLGIEPEDDGLAALAMTLAATLDEGAGARLANVAREFRMVLNVLERRNPMDSELDAFLASLSDPVDG